MKTYHSVLLGRVENNRIVNRIRLPEIQVNDMEDIFDAAFKRASELYPEDMKEKGWCLLEFMSDALWKYKQELHNEKFK